MGGGGNDVLGTSVWMAGSRSSLSVVLVSDRPHSLQNEAPVTASVPQEGQKRYRWDPIWLPVILTLSIEDLRSRIR